MPDDTEDLPDLLEGLERIWRRAGGDWLNQLRPGLRDPEIDALTKDLPMRLPRAARMWFAWHDGTYPELGTQVGYYIGGSRLRFFTLAAAVGSYHWRLDLAREVSAAFDMTPAKAGWDATWFPLMTSTGGNTISIDCSTSPYQPAPLRRVLKEDLEPERIQAPSLAAVVRVWLQLHEWGAFRFNRETGRWEQTEDYLRDRGFTAAHPLPEWLEAYSVFA